MLDMPKAICSMDGCPNPVKTRELCNKHYLRAWREGLGPQPSKLERFLLKIGHGDRTECWVWTGWLSAAGYGGLQIDGVQTYAHRYAYELLVGPTPEGLELDHLCRNRACCNPAHLEPVTHRENLLRGAGIAAINAAKTHCPKGHPYDEANTRTSATGRWCKACSRISARRYKRRIRSTPDA